MHLFSRITKKVVPRRRRGTSFHQPSPLLCPTKLRIYNDATDLVHQPSSSRLPHHEPSRKPSSQRTGSSHALAIPEERKTDEATMTVGGDGPPLSMRPFPVADKSPKNLTDFIARVNALPGGFRAVTETGLEEEIDEDGTQDVDMSDDAEDDDEEDADAKDHQATRAEVLRNIDIASNTAMLTLDSLSLLLSKQNPTQAGLTLSQQLREMVGIGTMGADRLDDDTPAATPAKTADREAVAVGWTLMEINAARDAAEDATAFLAAEMAAEGRYWEGVMAVRQAGWSVCRVPREPGGTLGVRFGFSEAAPEFQRNGLAPLRRGDEDGVARLDIGRLGGTQERLVVTYERDGKVVGRAAPCELNTDEDEEQDLEARVLGARNTIFAQELWHELTREARSLAAYDVRADGEKRLVCAVQDDGDARIVVELLPISACQPPTTTTDEPLPEDATAQATSLALHILLTYAHRCNEMLRTRPFPPHVPRARSQHIVHTLLRPVVARLTYARSAASATHLVGNLVRSLRNAGLASASFTLRTPQPTIADLVTATTTTSQPPPPAAVALVRAMLQPTDFAIDVALLPDVSFAIRGRTYLVPVTATYYHVLAPADAAIHTLCAPYADGYPDVEALASYLGTLARHAVSTLHLERLKADGERAGLQDMRIRSGQVDTQRRLLHVKVVCGAGEGETRLTVTSVPSSDVDGTPIGPAWTWTPDTETSAKETLEAVVDKLLKKAGDSSRQH